MKTQQHIALFLIVLVLTLPFYAAQSLAASVQIITNTGDKQIPGFVSAQQDTWVVEAKVSDPNVEITPENVKLQVAGGGQTDFTSCSDSVCKYVSPIKGSITPGEYLFSVIFGDASDSSSVRADGVAPQVTNINAEQSTDGSVMVSFIVVDPIPGVGISEVSILTHEDKELYKKTDFTQGAQEIRQDLTSQFSGEGVQRLKIKTTDKLGHTATKLVNAFFVDRKQPVISNLTFSGNGYVGAFATTTSFSVDVVDHRVASVTAQSEHITFGREQASCQAVSDKEDTWRCSWEDVTVDSNEKVSVSITAVDEKNNLATTTLSQSFKKDATPPQIISFGTAREFEGKSFIKRGENTLYLVAKEEGAGFSSQTIAANLAAFGQGQRVEPYCENVTAEQNTLSCEWDFTYTGSASPVNTGLTVFSDFVENEGEKKILSLEVDTLAPLVEDVRVFGSEKKNGFIQSQDKLLIELVVQEANGLTLLVDLRDLVLDAQESLPPSKFKDEAGWQVFTEQDCKLQDDAWHCELLTVPVRSGPDPAAALGIEVQDTAGNVAVDWPQARPQGTNGGEDGEYTIELLGAKEEVNPNHWEVKKVAPVGDQESFIDLDTTQLTQTRLAYKVDLHTKTRQARLLTSKIALCKPKEAQAPAPKISRNLLYGELANADSPNPAQNIILEFEPFNAHELFKIGANKEEDFEKVTVTYECTLLLTSRVGSDAITTPEQQTVDIPVSFAFTQLGALDENLEFTIRKEKEYLTTGFFAVWNTLVNIMKIIDYIVQVVNIAISIWSFVKSAMVGVDALAQFKGAGTAAAISHCFGVSTFERTQAKVWPAVKVPLEILSCRPQSSSLGWYKTWVDGLLSIYNVEILKSPSFSFGPAKTVSSLGKDQLQFRKARDLRQNLLLSVMGICVPGIIQNLDRFKQIHCRHIICLEKEVAAGTATVHTCQALSSLLICKYVLGELWYLIPFSQLWDKVIQSLTTLAKNPISAIQFATVVGCGVSCLNSETPNTLSNGCVYAYYFWEAFKILDQMISFVVTVVDDVEKGGLDYCSQVLNEPKKEPAKPAPSQTPGQQQQQPAATTGTTSQAVTAPTTPPATAPTTPPTTK